MMKNTKKVNECTYCNFKKYTPFPVKFKSRKGRGGSRREKKEKEMIFIKDEENY